MDVDDVEENVEENEVTRVKRFKHQSYSKQLKEVHLPSALSRTSFDSELADNECHFHEALDHWRQLNLSPSLLSFAHKADPLSASMPLLLHNWREIVDLWVSSLEPADDEGLSALLDLFQKMAHDLRATLSPVYPDILDRLLKLLSHPISAPALTALLSTFSSLFKYLLIPSAELSLLEQTWLSIHRVLTKCVPEVQRAMAEVWASVLRRLKPIARTKAVGLIAANVVGIEDSCAWVFVYACQSVSQTLHTATTSIVSPLLLYHLSCKETSATSTLIRRVLTAFIHHVKSADQFATVGDLLVAQFVDAAGSSTCNRERLGRMLEVIAIPCSVRHGSRLSEKQLSTLASQFPPLLIAEDLHDALLKFAVSVLMAGNPTLWSGLGRKMIDCSCEYADFGVKFCGSLAELDWGGWKMVALPIVLKLTPQFLEKEPRRTVQLLATLHRERKLGEVDLVWKQRLESWVRGRLTHWEKSEETVVELEDILALAGFFPSISALLIQIITVTLECPQPKTDFEASYANSARVLSMCMQGLSNLDVATWADQVDLASWTRTAVDKWGWSDVVIGGLVALLNASSSEDEMVTLDALYPALQEGLLSHSRSLRLSTMRLLSSKLVKSSGGELEVLKRCLQGEMVSLDVQGVRERVLRIGRVSQVVKDDIGADICSRWLIAQLKVNLRPLWSSAAEALAVLSQRFGDRVWQIVFSELSIVCQDHQTGHEPSWMENGLADGNKDEDPREEERSWRDPSAHKFRITTRRWINDDRRVEFLQNQNSRDRLDFLSFELQLLSTLRECSSLAEKHNRDLIPLFLSLAGPDAASKISRQKLSAWLTLFAKFTNPKALYATNALHNLYISVLSHADRSIQKLSLSCLFTYKSTHLVPYEDRIRALLDETRWRDELTAFDFEEIEPQDRREFVNVMIRLLFGLMLEKKGRTRGADRRAAVLGSLGGCTDQELGLLVDLMLKPIHSHSNARRADDFALCDVPERVSEKQQIGFLTLLGDVLKNLGPRLASYWPALLGTTIDLIGGSQKRIEGANHNEENIIEDVEGEEEDGMEEASSSSKITRSVRQLGVKRFADFFRSPVAFDYTPFMKESFLSFISPRLPALDKENTQAPSALLELFYVWTTQNEYVKFLVDFDARTVPKIFGCLIATNVKPAVISRIYDIVDQLLVLSTVDNDILETVVKPHMSLLLTNLSLLIERTKGMASVSSPLGQRQIGILSEIAQYSTDVNQACTLLGLFSPLLRKPPKILPEKIKISILKILSNLLALIPDLSDRSTPIYTKTYELFSQLFQSFRSRPARQELVSAFHRFATIDSSLQPLATLLESLNAYSSRRMDEPDFDRRLSAFATLNETLYKTLSLQDWLPLLYNMLHFIQEPTELAVRNNASFALRHFVDLASDITLPEYEKLFLRVVYPGIKNGLRSRNEPVRTEVLGVMAYAVTKCDRINSLQEMRVLLAGGDEEANFFNNVHHVQTHRRTRALRRLADQCEEGHLCNNTLAEIFVPLVSNYITATASHDHHLINEAIVTTGRMAKHLAWGAYYVLVQKYLRASRAKDESERVYVRTLVAILDSFHFPMEEVVLEVEKSTENDAEDAEDTPPPPVAPNARAMGRIADSVNLHLLPNLLQHLEKRDATTEDVTRIPIAIGIAKVAMHLPATTREPQISRLLTILSQILRSRSQDTRDNVRDTLLRMAVNLGPSCLPLMLREMRAALLRGPQLHVLAYVTHALLVYVTTGEYAKSFHKLDECVSDVAYISAEVVFGESGKDVQSDEFKTKMREVRTSSAKGLDSFSIMAKFITPAKISGLLMPLRSIMYETESVKVMQLVDDALRRIASGLNANEHLVPSELLVLCHTLISQNARFLKQASSRRKGPAKGDAIVRLKRQAAMEDNHYSNNSFRFVAFGLDLLNTALRRNRFDFRDPSIIARLESMIAVVESTLYSSNTSVLVLGLKVAAAIVKCPLKSLDESLPVILRQIIDIVRQTGSTQSEVVQAAFRALSTIFRDCPTAQVKEKDLAYLLNLISPDLEEPSRQASVFTMLRAIVSRKFVVPEIYDVLDKVSEIMVTNQSPQVQELCRGVLLQFLLDYPQGKGRLRNQMTFLAKNLSYVYESGRKSVMELLAAVVAKFDVSLVREYADLLFIALVMVIANDDSAKCREMASQLIKTVFARLDDDHRRIIMSHLHSWSAQHSQPQLARVSSQIYGLVIDVLRSDALPYTSAMLEDLNSVLEHSTHQLASVEKGDGMEVDLEWQVPYHALSVLTKLLQVFPNLTTRPEKVVWKSVVSHLLFTHAWVRTASCRLLGLLFAAVPVAAPESGLPDDSPMSGIGMQDVAKQLCLQLKSEHLDAPLSLQIVRNLFYIGKCLCAIPIPDAEKGVEEKFDDEDVEGQSDSNNPLPWLFSKLSYQIKSAHIARRNRSVRSDNWSHQPSSILRWFAAMASYMEPARLELFLVHILTPVYRITEDDTIRDPQMDEMKTLASELQDLVQSKVGITKFSQTYNRIRQGVLGVQRERKAARVMQAKTNPEAAAKRKLQRNVIKKGSRKRKNTMFADSKGRTKRRREE